MAKRKREDEMVSVSFVTLGCAKNLVDTEKMLGLLAEGGLAIVAADMPADVTIINTCGFIEDARQEALEEIDRALEAKQAGELGRVIVTGCLAQYWGERLFAERPGLDAVVGLSSRDEIAKIALTVANKSGTVIENREFTGVSNDQVRLRITEGCWSYLRISEGCDRWCSFCTIPLIRGKFRSKRPDAILAEAAELAGDGVRELNLIGQETSRYGDDIGYEAGLAGLLRELDKVDGLRWVRLIYTHPASMSDELIEAMGQCAKVVPYVDMPLQHINDRILGLMKRRVNRAETEKLLIKMRERIPNLSLRTTMLVGFPSETEAEFAELLEFVKQQRFEALGCFAYSLEKDTKSAEIGPMVPSEVRQERAARLMEAQQEIAFAKADELKGKEVECMILAQYPPSESAELGLKTNRDFYQARSAAQAPEMDSECWLRVEDAKLAKRITEGSFVRARIEGRSDYDLRGVVKEIVG